MAKYWKRKIQEYNERLDKGAIMDSQDKFDHGVHPMAPMSWSIKNKVGVVILIRGIGHVDVQCPGGTLVSGSGLCMLLR